MGGLWRPLIYGEHMEDFYWYEIDVKDGYIARAVMERQVSGKDLYMIGVGYLKQDFDMNNTGCFIFCEDTCNVILREGVPFTVPLFVDIFFDGVKRSLDLFKEPIDRMPLLINEKGMTGIIAKYRLEKNV